MKYFGINSIANAYMNFQGSMTNKSWGVLCIIKQLTKAVESGKTYEFSCSSLSNYIENLFCLSQNKKEYADNGKKWYIKFSTKWYTFFASQGKELPNIFDVIVWVYRKEPFSESCTNDDLISRFIRDFNLTADIIPSIFKVENIEISYSNSPCTEGALFAKISNATGITGNNITAEGKSVSASVGELSRGPFIQPLYAALDTTDYFLISQVNFDKMYIGGKINQHFSSSLPLQQIYYGAPGTGKSHTINEITKQQPEENVFRTTFHPDSDYSTFVGCYKPTTERVRCYGLNSVGETKTIMNLERGSASPLEENRITYQFVPQAFTRAYVQAWNNTAEDVFLIIEEINRGNCAQIFGDLFQLLDRGDDGRSCYPIDADTDLRQHLEKELGTESEGIKNGKLCLPANLHIWATMNTSDQSLFPIDSAFKRRWEWRYVPIQKPDNENYIIDIAGTHYDWWTFLGRINKVIGDTTNSEDKKMGYFFVKAKEGVIDANQFVGKVLFYIWNDVFKNYGFDNHIFSKEGSEKFEFSKFFDAKGNANIAEVNDFLRHLEKTIKIEEPMELKAETPATEQTDSQSAETEA